MTLPRDGRRARQRRISLSATLLVDGRRLPGRMRQLSSKGCRVSFEDLVLAGVESERLRLEFDGLLLLEPLVVEAIVRGRTEVDRRVLLNLEFADPEQVQQEVPYVLLVEFTRRASPRVPTASHPTVLLRGDDFEGQGQLVEVSSGGAGLRIPYEHARYLAKDDELELSFRLPESLATFQMRAAVRALHPTDGGVGASVQFLEEGSVEFAQQTERLGTLVDRRLESDRPLDEARKAI